MTTLLAWDAVVRGHRPPPTAPGAVAAWHSQVTWPAGYTTSVELVGVTTTTSPDRESATVTGCALTWNSPIDGLHPGRRPRLPRSARMALRRVLGQGYRITGYRPC